MKTRNLKMNRCITVCMGSDCKDKGAKKIWKKLEKSLKEQKLRGRVRLAQCKCADDCKNGPHVMLYPEGPWFYEVSPKEVDELMTDLASRIKVPQ